MEKDTAIEWSNRDQAAQYLLAIAAKLATRIRDENPLDNREWIKKYVPDSELTSLVMILAALVPDDQTVYELLSWYYRKPSPQPLLKAYKTYWGLLKAGCPEQDIPTTIVDAAHKYEQVSRDPFLPPYQQGVRRPSSSVGAA